MPVDAHSRPLLDDRRAVVFACLLGRASLTIDRTALSDIEPCVRLSRTRLSDKTSAPCSDLVDEPGETPIIA